VAWFRELDAWTEYWDIYHPETRGRFYFGDGEEETGLLTTFLPRDSYPPAWLAWVGSMLGHVDRSVFLSVVRGDEVAVAVREVDALVGSLFEKHFGDPTEPSTQQDYLSAMFCFAKDSLPACPERAALLAPGDPRLPTAGRHALEGDLMWFAWALQLEAARALAGRDDQHSRRTLQMAGVALGCGANFAWRGHRRTRSEYAADDATVALLRSRGVRWASDYDAALGEVHALYRLREWGEDV
jgi:hypothetical protein